MIYIDTNVVVYAIENHPRFGPNCKRILEDVEGGSLEAGCSVLVLVELINVLKRINDGELRGGRRLSIEKNVQALLSLPIVWLDMDLAVIERASTYAFAVNGVDYVHVASMEINSMVEIISADKDLDKVRMISRIDPLNYEGA